MRGYPTFLLDQLKSEDSIIPVKSTAEVSWIGKLLAPLFSDAANFEFGNSFYESWRGAK